MWCMTYQYAANATSPLSFVLDSHEATYISREAIRSRMIHKLDLTKIRLKAKLISAREQEGEAELRALATEENLEALKDEAAWRRYFGLVRPGFVKGIGNPSFWFAKGIESLGVRWRYHFTGTFRTPRKTSKSVIDEALAVLNALCSRKMALVVAERHDDFRARAWHVHVLIAEVEEAQAGKLFDHWRTKIGKCWLDEANLGAPAYASKRYGSDDFDHKANEALRRFVKRTSS